MPRVTSQNTEPDTSEQDGMQQGGDHLQDSLARVQTDQDQLEQLELAPDPSTDSSTDSSTGNDPMMDDDVVPSDPVDAAVVALWDQLLSARAESSPGDRPTLTRNIAAELQDYMAGERTNGDVIDRLFEMRTMILGEQASIMYVVHDWTLPSLDALINGMSGLPSQKPMAREEMLEPLALLDRQEVKKASRSARRTFPEVVAIVAQVDQYFLGAVGKSGLIDAALAAADSIGDSTVGTIGDRNRAVWLLEDLVATLRQDTMPAQL